MKPHRPSDKPIPKTCPLCRSYVEFYIKNMPHDPEKPFMGKCAYCGKSFSLDECIDNEKKIRNI